MARKTTRIRGARLLVGTVLTVVVVVGLILAAYFTPLMSVKKVTVSGNSVVSADEIRAAAAVPANKPLLQVDTGASARRVAAIPRIASVRVKRSYPSTVAITVVERTPVAYIENSDGKQLVDDSGYPYAKADPPPGLPKLVTPNPGSGDSATASALSVLTGLPPVIAEQVSEVDADTPASVVLILKDKRKVDWGSDDESPAKAQTLIALLTQPGHEYNVMSPNNPTVK